MRYYKHVDRYIAVSEFYRNKMIEFGFDQNKIVHVPNFIDTNRYKYAGKDLGYGLYFGRLSKEKGIDTLIDACIKVPNIPMIITGTGPMEDMLREKVERLELNNVEFTGYRTGKELLELLEGASFTVLPSVWYENCPMSVMESLAVGTPVIGSNAGGIPELIEEEQDGLIYEMGNSDDLADKIRIMWSSPPKRRQMGKFGAEKIISKYDMSTHYQRIMDVYSQVK
jgi:glycosyltransferase involved in cell wall biosynthesis